MVMVEETSIGLVPDHVSERLEESAEYAYVTYESLMGLMFCHLTAGAPPNENPDRARVAAAAVLTSGGLFEEALNLLEGFGYE